VLGRTKDASLIRTQKFKTADVTSEGAGSMMVFAMNIVRDSPTHGHELRTRRYGEEPVWQGKAQNRLQRDSRFASQHAGICVKLNEAVEASRIQKYAAIVQATVAIASPFTINKDRARESIEIRDSRNPR
jgi:hypothetical protein